MFRVGMIGFAFFLGPLIVFVVLMEVVTMRRCRGRIDEWAAENDVQLASVSRRWLSAGAWGSGAWFFWRNGRFYRFFEVAAIGSEGSACDGTIRIYAGFSGYSVGAVQVQWRQ
jgi:hypothetical protein